MQRECVSRVLFMCIQLYWINEVCYYKNIPHLKSIWHAIHWVCGPLFDWPHETIPRGTSDCRGDVYRSLYTHVNPHEPLVLNQTGIIVLWVGGVNYVWTYCTCINEILCKLKSLNGHNYISSGATKNIFWFSESWEKALSNGIFSSTFLTDPNLNFSPTHFCQNWPRNDLWF